MWNIVGAQYIITEWTYFWRAWIKQVLETLRNLIKNFKAKDLCWNYCAKKILFLGGIIKSIIRKDHLGNNRIAALLKKENSSERVERWSIYVQCLLPPKDSWMTLEKKKKTFD